MFKFQLTRLVDTSILFEVLDTDIDFSLLSSRDNNHSDFDFIHEGYDCLFYNAEMTNIHIQTLMLLGDDDEDDDEKYMDISLNNKQRACIVKDQSGRPVTNKVADQLMIDLPKILKRFTEICPK